ncbi:MAG: oxidoreductase [Mycobacterium sp.]|nr:oxidoreductase [Mycobacterium sp.]
MESVYEAAGAMDGLIRLANAWHQRVLADEIAAHPFSHGIEPDHTERLAAYWAEALGGPPAYTSRYGDEAKVLRTHACNGPHDELDERAIGCFDQALADVGYADPLRQVLHDYFAWVTTGHIAQFHGAADALPDGMRIPAWSWTGRVDS